MHGQNEKWVDGAIHIWKSTRKRCGFQWYIFCSLWNSIYEAIYNIYVSKQMTYFDFNGIPMRHNRCVIGHLILLVIYGFFEHSIRAQYLILLKWSKALSTMIGIWLHMGCIDLDAPLCGFCTYVVLTRIWIQLGSLYIKFHTRNT